MPVATFVRRAAHWVVLWAVGYTVVDWFSPRPDREPNFMLWIGLSLYAAETVGGVWSRRATVVAAVATGVAYVLLVVALQAVTATVGGAGVWRPKPFILLWATAVIAGAAYFQAGRARRRAQTEAELTVAETSEPLNDQGHR